MTNPHYRPHVSVIVPVGTRHSDIAALYADYRQGLAATGASWELIFVLDGLQPDVANAIARLQSTGEPVTMIQLTRRFGDATALMAGFEHASGEIVLTLPAYFQIQSTEIGKLIAALERCDISLGVRSPRRGGLLERLRRSSFHGLLASVTGLKYRDLGCSARAMKRIVLQEINLYGDQHRFLPVLADRQGFRVLEVPVAQSPHDKFHGAYGPRAYTRGFLDIFTVFFLARFTKKPLRFFGMVGVSTFSIGAILVLWLVIERLFFDQALADRPALLLSSLLVVLGLQVFALGLLGELIIFTHAKHLKDYQVAEVVQFDAVPPSERIRAPEEAEQPGAAA